MYSECCSNHERPKKIHTQEKYTRATRGRFIKEKKEGNNIFMFYFFTQPKARDGKKMKSKKCCFVFTFFFKLLVTKLIRTNSGKMMSKEEGMMASTHNQGDHA